MPPPGILPYRIKKDNICNSPQTLSRRPTPYHSDYPVVLHVNSVSNQNLLTLTIIADFFILSSFYQRIFEKIQNPIGNRKTDGACLQARNCFRISMEVITSKSRRRKSRQRRIAYAVSGLWRGVLNGTLFHPTSDPALPSRFSRRHRWASADPLWVRGQWFPPSGRPARRNA